MADNYTFKDASGTEQTAGADDIGSVKYPRVKVGWGPDGTFNDTDVASGKPLPVQIRDSSGSEVSPATAANQSTELTRIGALDETAPANDTASSGLNGRMQRIAQRITSLIALLPAALTGSGNLKTAVQEALPAGDNNIGNVDIVTQPALAATTDNVGAKLATDKIMSGTTALTPKFAIIDAASNGDNTLISAVASNKIRVLAVYLVAAAAVTVRFESGAGGTALSGQMNLAANGGFVLPFNPVGWFETGVNTLLNLELGGAVSVDGSIVYVEVP